MLIPKKKNSTSPQQTNHCWTTKLHRGRNTEHDKYHVHKNDRQMGERIHEKIMNRGLICMGQVMIADIFPAKMLL